MGYKELVVFVEGHYDKYFFRKIIQPSLMEFYNDIKIKEYANDQNIKVNSFLKSINQSEGIDYIFIADMDKCSDYSLKKQELKRKFKDIDGNSIYLVMKEIEGWYLSGLDKKALLTLKFKPRQDCNNIIKESFDSSIPRNKDKSDFLNEVTNVFKIPVAKKQSPSFGYLCENLGL